MRNYPLRYLLRFLIVALLFITVPLASYQGSFVSAAWADDGDGDGDGDGGGGGGEGGGNWDGGNATPRTPGGDNFLNRLFRPAPQVRANRPRVVQPLPTRAAREIVVLGLSEGDLATLVVRGYEVIDSTQLAGIGNTLRRLQVPSATTPEDALLEIRQLPTGQSADFNHYYRAGEGFAPLPCEGLHCKAFELIKWIPPGSPTAACRGHAARIGLIDTGINPDHEAFANSRLSVLQLGISDEDRSDLQHGTAVAAILIGSRTGRTHGLLPDAQLVAVDVFYKKGRDERSDAFRLVQAMDQLAVAKVHVINMSLAGPHNVLLENMVTRLADERILTVSAAGNGGPRAAPVFPGAYGPVLTVTAVDQSGQVYRRAGQGPHLDLAAPGVEVWTAASIRGARAKTGTSFATPFVTAAAALLMSMRTDMTLEEVKSFLRVAAFDLGAVGHDDIYGAGLVQFAPICAMLSDPVPAELKYID